MGDVAGAVAAMMRESPRHTPVSIQTPDGSVEQLADDVSPLISLLLYLCSQAAVVRDLSGGERTPSRPRPVKTRKGMPLFPPERLTTWEVAYRLGAALRRASPGSK